MSISLRSLPNRSIMEVAMADSTYSSPAKSSEVSDDSEADSIFFAPCFAAAEDEDDAESCSGGEAYGNGEEEPRSGRSERCGWMTWTSWLMERAAPPEEVAVGERRRDDQGATAANCGRDLMTAGAAAVAAEGDKIAVEETDRSNRLFWEACLDSGY